MRTLRNRSFSLLMSGQLVSKLGNNLYMIALPWYVYVTTGSKLLLAVTGLAQSLPAIAGLFSGVFVDRWQKRKVMLTVDVIRVVLCVALFLLAVHHANIYTIVVTVLLLETAGRFFGPAATSIIPIIVSSEDLAEASGLEQSGGGIAQLVGTIAGGPLIQGLGAPFLFLANAITYGVSVLSLGFLKVSEPIAQPTEPPSFVREWLEGFSITLKSRFILLITLAAMAANFGFAAFDISLTAWVKGPMHGNAIDLALVGASFFSGVLAGGVALGPISKVLNLRTILVGGLFAVAGLTGLVGFKSLLWWAMPILFLVGIGVSLMNGALGAFAYQVVPSHVRGRVFGTLSAASTLTAPLGMALYGYLMIHIPLHILFILIAIPAFLSGVSLLVPTKDDSGNLEVGLEA